MLDAERVRDKIREGIKEALGPETKIDKDEFNKIWGVIIGELFSEITTNGQVVDKDDPTTQIGTIK